MKKILLFCASAVALILCSSCQCSSSYQQISQASVNTITQAAPFALSIHLPAISGKTYSILAYGAKPDGTELATEAIQAAIDDASKAGGGTVLIPAGVYITGPIVLKSHVRLYAEQNALVLFSPDFSLYPIHNTSFEGLDTKRCQSPISAYDAEDIAICGKGVFDGNGAAWRPLKKSKVTTNQWKAHLQTYGGCLSEDEKTWYPTEGARYAQTLCVDQNVPQLATDSDWEYIHAFLRPVMLHFVRCKRVLLEGVTFENSPAWNLHPLMCEDVVLTNLTVRNPWYSQNGDGVDIESCQRVLIQDCSFDVGDDAICMKSGKNEDGRRRGIPTEDVYVNQCVVYHGHGGFVVGSEMSGDVRRIAVSNCSFIGTDVGLRFKSTRGRGGIVEDIFINGIYMSDIPNDALTFDLFYGGKGVGEETAEEIAARMNGGIPNVTVETPQFQHIVIENVVCKGAKRGIYFNGLPEMPIQDVTLRNITMTANQPNYFNQTENLVQDNVTILLTE